MAEQAVVNKTDLVKIVADKAELTQTQAQAAVNALIEAVETSLRDGKKVTVTGFGTFEVRATKARVGTNPSNKQKIQIPAGKRVSFSAGAVLKKMATGKEDKAGKKSSAKKPGKKK
jgi:DNA-binding protein HU-beta